MNDGCSFYAFLSHIFSPTVQPSNITFLFLMVMYFFFFNFWNLSFLHWWATLYSLNINCFYWNIIKKNYLYCY